MSLRVNLIQDSERRSASPVSPRLMAYLGIVAALILAGVGVSSGIARARSLDTRLLTARAQWTKAEAEQKELNRLRRELETLKNAWREVGSFEKSRLEWSRDLDALADEVPPSIQFTALRITQVVATPTNEPPRRLYSLRISGRSIRETESAGLETFLRAFTKPAFTGTVERAFIPQGAFRQDPANDAVPGDRVFEISASCNPRSLE